VANQVKGFSSGVLRDEFPHVTSRMPTLWSSSFFVASVGFLRRPTSKQVAVFTEMLADHCALYNGALQERRDAYRHVSTTSITYDEQSAQLGDIRGFDPHRQGRRSLSSRQGQCAVWARRCGRCSGA
jgi:hypothetical protein